MQTIDKQSSEYANSNFQNCTYHYTDDKRLTDYDSIKDAFKAGVEFAQLWISVDEELPLCSDEDLLLKGIDDRGINGIVDIGYMHDSHDGKPCLSNFMSLGGVLITITHWRPIERV